MKTTFLALATVLALGFTSCKDNASSEVDTKKAETASASDSQQQKHPKLVFNDMVHDFGTINEGDVVEHDFTFKNEGDAPLIITNARASCGCTVPEYPKNKTIAPGDEGKMTIRFNSSGRPNQQMKSIRVSSNTEKGQETLRIKAFVTPKNKNAGSPVK
ncbi:MAG: DUF1573 domain-containing protein [Psychroflexus halocasei]